MFKCTQAKTAASFIFYLDPMINNDFFIRGELKGHLKFTFCPHCTNLCIYSDNTHFFVKQYTHFYFDNTYTCIDKITTKLTCLQVRIFGIPQNTQNIKNHQPSHTVYKYIRYQLIKKKCKVCGLLSKRQYTRGFYTAL